MARALELADLARGRTSPNPAVGAVVVRDGEIVGEGYTSPPGGPHAEIAALRQAGALARGATLYVTLEPCCHQGRTPPCTLAIESAGISTVNVAMLDPNPIVQGKGCQTLEAAGITVEVGDHSTDAREQIEGFTKSVLEGRPFVIAKWAMSADGKISTATRQSRWITGEAARAHAHGLRDVCEAVLVGVDTVIADAPRLTVRLPGSPRPERKQPFRVVVDSRGRTPIDASLVTDEHATRTIIATTCRSEGAWRRSICRRGADVIELPDDHDRVDLESLLTALGKRNVTSVLVEGGQTILGSFFDHALVDKVYVYLAPKVIGGRDALSPVGGHGAVSIASAWALRPRRWETVGDDMLLVGYPAAEVPG